MNTSVMVLNASFEPIQRVDLKHAIRMLVREVAVVEEQEGERMIGHLPFPKVLRLVKYVAMKWRSARAPSWSRKRLMARDKDRCAYCGKHATTVDHVIPISRGGTSSWLNTVAACSPCNNKKGHKTLHESRMKLLVTPFAPSWWDLNIVPGS
jgi:5-methylcytosine-specific restriction endonuclease McrA